MIVVTDTSVVLNLCLIGQEGLLPRLYGEILSPPSVRDEFARLADGDPRFAKLVFPGFIVVRPAETIHPELNSNHSIHKGEIEAISLAIESQAQAILMDERAGRHAASTLGPRCIGILGILIQAKSVGLIEAVSPLISQLETRGRFWIAPGLARRVLEAAGEI